MQPQHLQRQPYNNPASCDGRLQESVPQNGELPLSVSSLLAPSQTATAALQHQVSVCSCVWVCMCVCRCVCACV
jgi:hypothetical protein